MGIYQRVCEHCGSPFTCTHKKARFCSHDCWNIWRVVPPLDRIRRLCSPTPTEIGCVIWNGTLDRAGRPRLGGKPIYNVLKAVFEDHHGPINDNNKAVFRTCQNDRCVAIAHLYLDHRLRKWIDKHRAGKIQFGAAKLDKESVRQMRHKHAGGISRKDLQGDFLVSKTAVHDVIVRKSWPWID